MRRSIKEFILERWAATNPNECAAAIARVVARHNLRLATREAVEWAASHKLKGIKSDYNNQ